MFYFLSVMSRVNITCSIQTLILCMIGASVNLSVSIGLRY